MGKPAVFGALDLAVAERRTHGVHGPASFEFDGGLGKVEFVEEHQLVQGTTEVDEEEHHRGAGDKRKGDEGGKAMKHFL